MKLFATVKELGMQDNKYNVDDNQLSKSGLNLNRSVGLSHLFWNFDSTTSKSVSGSAELEAELQDLRGPANS